MIKTNISGTRGYQPRWRGTGKTRLVAACHAIFAAALLAQTGPVSPMKIMSGSTGLRSGVWVRFNCVLAWTGAVPGNANGSMGGISGTSDTIHRTLFDKKTSSWFGYDLLLVPDEAAKGYLATFLPPTGLSPRSTVSLLPPFKLPPPAIVHGGDTIELVLMASPDGSQKLIDYLEIHSHEPEPAAAATTATPADITLDDGPVIFAPETMTVWKQGVRIDERGFTGKPGSTLSIAFPKQGRYILSLLPRAGFTRAGTVRDNVVSFEDAGQTYEVRFMQPIAGAGKAWNLYVLHDAAFQPPENQRNIVHVMSDRLENLLPKH